MYEITQEENTQNSPDCGLQLIIVLLCNKRKTINNYYLYYYYYFRSLMSILHFVERHLGHIHWWPTIILKHLFIDQPTYLTTMSLIRFFYGNGIPCEIAIQLFQHCNDEVDFNQAQHFCYYYTT